MGTYWCNHSSVRHSSVRNVNVYERAGGRATFRNVRVCVLCERERNILKNKRTRMGLAGITTQSYVMQVRNLNMQNKIEKKK